MKLTRLGLLMAVMVPTAVGATTVRLHTEAEMVKHAAAIVRGRVVLVTPRWTDQGTIVTDVKVEVSRILKATSSRPTFTFTQMGGTLDGRTLHVAGTSAYEVNEEVLVFLETGGGSLVEMGVGAGKYRVDRSSGRAMVERQLRGLAFARVDNGRAVRTAPPLVRGPELLEALENRIIQHLAE